MDNILNLPLKNIKIGDWRIFKEDPSPMLTMAISFHCNNENISEIIFKYLMNFSIDNLSNQQQANHWYKVHHTLCMHYDVKAKQIYFKEKCADSIIYLPSLLCRDWRVITDEDKELLEIFISTNPLIENL